MLTLAVDIILQQKIDRGNPSAWHYGGSNWNTSSPVSETNCQNLAYSSGVNRGYYEYTLQTGFRIAAHYNPPSSITNYLSESKTGNNAKHFFNNSSSTQNSRANFITLFQNAGNDSGFVTNLSLIHI